MNAIIKYWDKIFFRRFDPIPISIFRIFLGITIIFMFICEFPNWENYYTRNGVLSLTDLDLKTSPYNWSLFYIFENTIPVKLFFLVGLSCAILFTIGLFTRFSTIILYIILFSKMNANPILPAGYDVIIKMLLFYSFFIPLNHYFAIDNFLIKKKREFPLIWPVRIIQIQICLVYVFTILIKLVSDKSWLNGDAIYYLLANNIWSRFPDCKFFYLYNTLFCKIATYATVFIEALFPILVWFKSTRIFALLMITIFHILLAFLMLHISIFSLTMISAFWVFVPSETSHKWLPFLKGNNQQ